MSFKAEIYRVLLASPSDLHEERLAATDVINEWNAQHAAAESVVLLPVKWETHTTPETGIRPQAAINTQLVQTSDILVGMFWTKFGSNTGVAESGTVEEIGQFVSAGKPVMLYFSSRPIDPNRLDLRQQQKLRKFKDETYRTALISSFVSLDELRTRLMRDLTAKIRQMRARRRGPRTSKLDEAAILTELMIKQRQHSITPDEFQHFRAELLNLRRRSNAQTTDPVQPGEIGPNGHRIEYTKDGDKVEWLPDDDDPAGGEVPMILRRGDKAIIAAEQEFFDVIWYDRKLVLIDRIARGEEVPSTNEIDLGMRKGMEKIERKYGKRKLKNYYKDDFEWGMINGKLSALRWVLGDEWDMLDT